MISSFSLYEVIAVIIYAQVSGMIWWGPLFGNGWKQRTYNGLNPPKSAITTGTVLSIICNMILIYFMKNLMSGMGIRGDTNSLYFGMMVAGIIFAANAPGYGYSNKSLHALFTEQGYNFVLMPGIAYILNMGL